MRVAGPTRRAACSATRACCWRRARPTGRRRARPTARGGAGLVELPIAVTPVARLPVIGTSLVLAPAWLRRRLVAAALRAPFFNLELHGIDLCRRRRPTTFPPRWSRASPICAARSPHKLAALDETLAAARAAGARFATLAEVAGRVAGAQRAVTLRRDDRVARQLVAALVLGDAGVAGRPSRTRRWAARPAGARMRAISSWLAFAFQPFDSTPIE